MAAADESGAGTRCDHSSAVQHSSPVPPFKTRTNGTHTLCKSIATALARTHKAGAAAAKPTSSLAAAAGETRGSKSSRSSGSSQQERGGKRDDDLAAEEQRLPAAAHEMAILEGKKQDVQMEWSPRAAGYASGNVSGSL